MNRKNSNAALIAVICAAVVIAFSVAAVMFAKGNSAAPDDEDFGDRGTLPESYVGSWELPADSHALQSPRNTDMSEDEAMADEYDFGVTMTYGLFSTNRVGGISKPSYRLTENCGSEPMDELGMQSDGIMDEFSANEKIFAIDQILQKMYLMKIERLFYYVQIVMTMKLVSSNKEIISVTNFV